MKNETVIQQLIETVDRFPDEEVFQGKKVWPLGRDYIAGAL